MRIAITGTDGRVGKALASRFSSRHEVIPLPRGVMDLADPDSIRKVLDGLTCDVFLHPAAMTSLEACEDDARLAMRVNSAAPGKIALWAAERGVRMIHFSTDYVFDGSASPLLDEAMPARPLSAYGRSKLAGERAVLAHPGHLVLRVSWVFGIERPAFVDRIFDDALAGNPLAAIGDKLSLPTSTADIAEWVESLMETDAEGILHACNPGPPVSWHGMASFVVGEMQRRGVLSALPEILATRLEDSTDFRAPRPRFTAMDTRRLSTVIGRPLRSWQVALAEHVALRCAAR